VSAESSVAEEGWSLALPRAALCATPRRATPRHFTPRHATPRHAAPRRAAPRRATPRRAAPRRAAPRRRGEVGRLNQGLPRPVRGSYTPNTGFFTRSSPEQSRQKSNTIEASSRLIQFLLVCLQLHELHEVSVQVFVLDPRLSVARVLFSSAARSSSTSSSLRSSTSAALSA
jgi:hypothetical protein